MNDLELESRAIAIAIRLISSCDVENIATLKKFLYFTRSSRCVRTILSAAVLQISQTSVGTTRWLLRHPEALTPEIDPRDIVTQYLTQVLTAYKFTSDQDFKFHADGTLSVYLPDFRRSLAIMASPSDDIALEILHGLIRTST